MTRNSKNAINIAIQEELVRILGFDWFLLFLQGSNLNKDTFVIGLVNLMILISSPVNYNRFKEGTCNSGWLREVDSLFSHSTSIQLLGLNLVSSSSSSVSSTSIKTSSNQKIIRQDYLTILGFQHLSWLMDQHITKPQAYLILFQGLVGHFLSFNFSVIDSIEAFTELRVDQLWICLFKDNSKINYLNNSITCLDLALVIISMIHTLIWSSEKSDASKNYPTILVQFLMQLYHYHKDFQNFCHSNPEFFLSLSQAILSEKKENDNEKEKETETDSFFLTDHEVRKYVMDFIKLVIVDSMICANNQSYPPSLSNFEIFLESFSNCKIAQIELIHSLIVYLDSLTEVMVQAHQFDSSSETQSSPIQQLTISNILLFATIVADKLWQDCYLRDPKEILDFQLKLVVRLSSSNPLQSSKKSKGGNLEINVIYRSLNRTVLYLLSRPLETIADRMSMLETLQKVHSSRSLILSPSNKDPIFFSCLTYCLLQLIDEEKIRLSVKSRTTWHVNLSTDRESDKETDEGALLIAQVARKIWDETYLIKRPLIEEALKVNLAPNNPNFGISSATPDLTLLRDTLYETTLKCWMNYIESEHSRQKRTRASIYLENLSSSSPTFLISEKFGNINKLTKVVGAGGVGLVSKIVGGTTGAVSGAISTAVSSTIKKEVFKSSSQDSAPIKNAVPLWSTPPYSDLMNYTLNHIAIVCELIEMQIKHKHQSDSHLLKYTYDDWIGIENELLLGERSIWGPDYGSKHLDKWKLDMTEGPNRMRKKLVKNDAFYINYPYRPEQESVNFGGKKFNKYKLPMSFDSKEYYKRYKPENHKLLERDAVIETDVTLEDKFISPVIMTQDHEVSFEGIKAASLFPSKTHSTDQEDCENSEFVEIYSSTEIGSASGSEGSNKTCINYNNWEQIEAQTVLRLLEDGEKISHMFRSARICGLDTYEGLLLFGKEHFYLIDGFTLLKTREIKDIDSIPLK